MERKERMSWTGEDVRALLQIWANEKIQVKLDGVCRNEEAMKDISAALAKLGITRSPRQIREKLKKLRAQYKAVKLKYTKRDVQRKKFPFFDLMDSVMSQRPSTTIVETVRDTMPRIDVPQTAESACSSAPPQSVSSPVSGSTASNALDEATNSCEVLSFLLEATGTPEPPSTSTLQPSGLSHHNPPPEPKRYRYNHGQMDFIAAMKEMAEKDREAERELRLQEAKMEEQLRREEMAQMEQIAQERSRETRELMAMLSTLLPQKPLV